jgi:hypothetical protein
VLGKRGFAARWTYYIDGSGKIAHIDKSVSPLTAAADIAERLVELGLDGGQ